MSGQRVVKTSGATLRRMPGYLMYLKNKLGEGVRFISSTVMAEDLKQNPVQIRKDLALVSVRPGKPKMGFVITELINDIEDFLGYNETNDAVLVGAGQLGRTLLSYIGFERYGLKIVAGFDVRKEVVGNTICGKQVFHFDRFSDLTSRLNVKIGIITVPGDSAQEVCDEMIRSGIKAIWNFAPIHINVPEGIIVKNEDLGASLALLSKELSEKTVK